MTGTKPPRDEDLSLGTPAGTSHPSDEDLSLGTPAGTRDPGNAERVRRACDGRLGHRS
jgi:hypothetical protein